MHGTAFNNNSSGNNIYCRPQHQHPSHSFSGFLFSASQLRVLLRSALVFLSSHCNEARPSVSFVTQETNHATIPIRSFTVAVKAVLVQDQTAAGGFIHEVETRTTNRPRLCVQLEHCWMQFVASGTFFVCNLNWLFICIWCTSQPVKTRSCLNWYYGLWCYYLFITQPGYNSRGCLQDDLSDFCFQSDHSISSIIIMTLCTSVVGQWLLLRPTSFSCDLHPDTSLFASIFLDDLGRDLVCCTSQRWTVLAQVQTIDVYFRSRTQLLWHCRCGTCLCTDRFMYGEFKRTRRLLIKCSIQNGQRQRNYVPT